MKRKGTLLIIVIFFILPFLFQQGNISFNITLADSEKSDFELIQELISLTDLNWSYGSFPGGDFIPVVDSEFTYDRTATVLHVLEASGDQGDRAGWYTSFESSGDAISVTFDMRVKAGHLDAVHSSFYVFNNETKKKLYGTDCFSYTGYFEQESLDTGSKSFNYTFFTNTTTSLLIFLGVNDGHSADWNQEMWLTNLVLNPSFYIDNLERVNHSQIIPFNSSSPRALEWHNDKLLVSSNVGITEFNTLTEEILNISYISNNHRALAFDGTYFWSARAFWTGSYDDYELKKYDQDYNQLSVINLNLPSSVAVAGRADVAYDGTYIWLAESQENEIYQLNKDTGALIKTISAPGPRITGMDFDGEHLWVCDGTLNQIFKLNTTDGSILDTYDAFCPFPWGITIDSSNNIWIVSSASPLIYKTYINTEHEVFPPEITGPDDIFIEEGSVGNYINWTLQDNNPNNYTIFRNDVEIAFDTWITDEIVSTSVDYLTSGVYNYTIVVYDSFGNKAIDTVILVVYIIVNEYTPYIFGLFGLILVSVAIICQKKRKS